MALLNDILVWTESLPLWQRDACRRLLKKETGLDDKDYSELYDLLKIENGLMANESFSAQPLSAEHLPSEVVSGKKVTLLGIKELRNVNQIPADHTLPFAKSGLTVIYGANGSGKSGYARVMKRACRAREQSEPIYPDVRFAAAQNNTPSATFDIEVSGSSDEVEWSLDRNPPEILSTISVFDSKCARSYVTSEKDAAYLPYGLDIVENLAFQVIPKLSDLLKTELDSIDVSKLPFNHLVDETEVGAAIKDLSEKSDIQRVASLGTLREAEVKELADLEVALRESNPFGRARELRFSADRLKAFADSVSRPLIWVRDEAVEKLRNLNEEKEVAEAAEQSAAVALRSGEDLFSGTGGRVWKILFESARRYATECVHPGREFPDRNLGAACPLCQEELSEAGLERFKRFDEYLKNDVSKTADIARKKVEAAKVKIQSADLQFDAEAAIKEEIKHLDESLLEAVGSFQKSVDARRAAMLECLETSQWEKIPSLSQSPRARLRELAASQLKAHRRLVKAADIETRKRLQRKYVELSSRRSLSEVLEAVIELHSRMKRKAALRACLSSLKTRPISDKSKELASAAVTEELRSSLDEEFKALGIGHIKTKLKERSDRGRMLHQLVLDLPVAKKLEEILSEGEQRAIALGAFFAELALANHKCGIVFDDPVSSLDHRRRGLVAKRLVRESAERQVIVFTHDVVFLEQLRTMCAKAHKEPAIISLNRVGSRAGVVSMGLPWQHKSFGERIDSLEKAQRKLKSIPWPAEPTEEQASAIIREYSLLRATIERVVQDHFLNGTVQRFRDYIDVKRLPQVVGLQQKEVDELVRLNQRCHDMVEAHDPSSAKDEPPPTPDELAQDISDLRKLVEQVKDRRNKH